MHWGFPPLALGSFSPPVSHSLRGKNNSKILGRIKMESFFNQNQILEVRLKTGVKQSNVINCSAWFGLY